MRPLAQPSLVFLSRSSKNEFGASQDWSLANHKWLTSRGRFVTGTSFRKSTSSCNQRGAEERGGPHVVACRSHLCSAVAGRRDWYSAAQQDRQVFVMISSNFTSSGLNMFEAAWLAAQLPSAQQRVL
jgi:hypothetical protein